MMIARLARVLRAAPRLVLAASAIGSVALGSGIAMAAGLPVAPAGLGVFAGASTAPASTCTLAEPEIDSTVDQAAGGTNYGTNAALEVRSAIVLLLGQNKRSLLRFDVASCGLPATTRVTSATLELFLAAAPSASRTYAVHRVTGAWTETGVTWNNQPAVTGTASASAVTGTTGDVRLAWNVTSDVQAFAQGTANAGWRIADTSESSSASGLAASFRSREYAAAADRPRLVIKYYP